MGMCLAICSASDGDISALLSDPPLVWKLIAPDDDEAYMHSRGSKTSWFSWLFGKKKEALSLPTTKVTAIDETDIDKASMAFISCLRKPTGAENHRSIFSFLAERRLAISMLAMDLLEPSAHKTCAK